VSNIASSNIQSNFAFQAMTKYILEKTPTKYHAHMIPDYRTDLIYESPTYVLKYEIHSCRLQENWLVFSNFHDILCNLIFAVADSGFLNSLHRPNLTLNFDGIAEVVENGIVTKTGMCAPSLTS
jgi:hypothetical protein